MSIYAQKIEDAIAEADIDRLIRYAYGDTCRCQKIKGEPQCVCKMFAAALREKIAPRALFQNRIERIGVAS